MEEKKIIKNVKVNDGLNSDQSNKILNSLLTNNLNEGLQIKQSLKEIPTINKVNQKK